MKFRRGAWLWEPGFTPHVVRRVQSLETTPTSLRVNVVDVSGTKGVDSFEGTVLQLELTAPLPGVIRVRAVHHRPAPGAGWGFPLQDLPPNPHAETTVTDTELSLRSGDLTLRLPRKGGWSMRFETPAGTLTTGGGDCLSLVERAPNGGITQGDTSGSKWLVQRLSLDVGEHLYGFGERFGPFVKNGQTVTTWNEDGGTNSEWAYKSLPFFLSSKGYGVLVNSAARVEFELATEHVTQTQFSVPGDVLDYFILAGPDPKGVLEKLTRLTGRPALPPAWSLGLWLSTSFTTDYTEKTVTEFVDGMAARDIPLSVFHFDCFWMKERRWCDFAWDKDAFPDPAAMLKRLKARGLKICLWINPYISGLSPLFNEAADLGLLLKRPDGAPFQRDQWQPSMGLVDFTNPAAVKWFQSKLQPLLDIGVDSFKTDFGERIPTEGVRWHSGADPALMHNFYPHLYNKAVFDLLEHHHGKHNALVFARAATAGAQQFPVHWGGDCEATFPSMAESLRAGLSFCLSGPAFWSHDIGGFAGTANPAVYKRWTAFGLLSTHSRLHGSESYRVPWLFDDEAVAVMRHFAKLKNRLFPYLYAAAVEAHTAGTPMLRAMLLEFPHDPACRTLDRQYLLGPSLLVAPIFRDDHTAEFYLPQGTWTSLQTGERHVGGSWRSETHDFFSLPLLVRPGTLLPTQDRSDTPTWSPTDPLTLTAYDLPDGQPITAHAATGDATLCTFTARREGSKVTFTSDGRATHVSVRASPTAAPVAWPRTDQPLVVSLG